jgi:hypothetical protein
VAVCAIKTKRVLGCTARTCAVVLILAKTLRRQDAQQASRQRRCTNEGKK